MFDILGQIFGGGLKASPASRAGKGKRTNDGGEAPDRHGMTGEGTSWDGGAGSSRLGLPGRTRPRKSPRSGKTSRQNRPGKSSRQRRAGTTGRKQRTHSVRDARAARTHQPTSRHTAARDYRDLAKFARDRGFTVTSTNGGRHNKGSAHYEGRAVDVRTRDKSPAQVDKLIREARAAGFKVHDERRRPPGQRVWSGPHIHLEIPRRR